MGGQEHFYMETQSMLVVPVGEETEFNVYVSTQWPTLTQVHRDTWTPAVVFCLSPNLKYAGT